MSQIDKILKEMENAPQDVRFSRLAVVCEHFFGTAGKKEQVITFTRRHGRATLV